MLQEIDLFQALAESFAQLLLRDLQSRLGCLDARRLRRSSVRLRARRTRCAARIGCFEGGIAGTGRSWYRRRRRTDGHQRERDEERFRAAPAETAGGFRHGRLRRFRRRLRDGGRAFLLRVLRSVERRVAVQLVLFHFGIRFEAGLFIRAFGIGIVVVIAIAIAIAIVVVDIGIAWRRLREADFPSAPPSPRRSARRDQGGRNRRPADRAT